MQVIDFQWGFWDSLRCLKVRETRQTHSPEGKTGGEGPKQQATLQAPCSPPPAAAILAAPFLGTAGAGCACVPFVESCLLRHGRPEQHVSGVYFCRRVTGREGVHTWGTSIGLRVYSVCVSTEWWSASGTPTRAGGDVSVSGGNETLTRERIDWPFLSPPAGRGGGTVMDGKGSVRYR